MFLDNLSAVILQICDANQLNYEKASERCEISSRYLGDIVRRKSAPTITVLEKMCMGFELTPNDLLIPAGINHELSFRKSLPITDVYVFRTSYSFAVCPRCKRTLEREYQNYCDRCGQKLGWENYSSAKKTFIGK